jgi:hypothetical protein
MPKFDEKKKKDIFYFEESGMLCFRIIRYFVFFKKRWEEKLHLIPRFSNLAFENFYKLLFIIMIMNIFLKKNNIFFIFIFLNEHIKIIIKTLKKLK